MDFLGFGGGAVGPRDTNSLALQLDAHQVRELGLVELPRSRPLQGCHALVGERNDVDGFDLRSVDAK